MARYVKLQWVGKGSHGAAREKNSVPRATAQRAKPMCTHAESLHLPALAAALLCRPTSAWPPLLLTRRELQCIPQYFPTYFTIFHSYTTSDRHETS